MPEETNMTVSAPLQATSYTHAPATPSSSESTSEAVVAAGSSSLAAAEFELAADRRVTVFLSRYTLLRMTPEKVIRLTRSRLHEPTAASAAARLPHDELDREHHDRRPRGGLLDHRDERSSCGGADPGLVLADRRQR